MKKRNRRICILLVLAWTLVIFAFSLQPGNVSSDTSLGFGRWLLETFFPSVLDSMESLSIDELAKFHHLLRKCAHFTEYMILGMLAVIGMMSLIEHDSRWRWWYPWGYCVCVASMDETIQRFVPGRAGMVKDVCLDSVGAFAGVVIIFGILYYIKTKARKN